jgi:hypothetical protein
MSAHLIAPRTFVKNDTISSSSAIPGTTNVPLMPCTRMPKTSGNGIAPPSMLPSMTDLSNTPPPSTHLLSPAIAQTITIAWTATSAATR